MDMNKRYFQKVKESFIQDSLKLKVQVTSTVPNLARYRDMLDGEVDILKGTTIMPSATLDAKLNDLKSELKFIQGLLIHAAELEGKLIRLQRFVMEARPSA